MKFHNFVPKHSLSMKLLLLAQHTMEKPNTITEFV